MLWTKFAIWSNCAFDQIDFHSCMVPQVMELQILQPIIVVVAKRRMWGSHEFANHLIPLSGHLFEYVKLIYAALWILLWIHFRTETLKVKLMDQ